MKNSFKILGAFTFLIALVVTFSAFKANDHKKVRVAEWFQYNGSGDRTQPENYTHYGVTAPGCSGTEEVCAIKAMDNGNGEPEITSQLVNEINAAIANDTPSANVSLLD